MFVHLFPIVAALSRVSYTDINCTAFGPEYESITAEHSLSLSVSLNATCKNSCPARPQVSCDDDAADQDNTAMRIQAANCALIGEKTTFVYMCNYVDKDNIYVPVAWSVVQYESAPDESLCVLKGSHRAIFSVDFAKRDRILIIIAVVLGVALLAGVFVACLCCFCCCRH